MHFQQEKVQYRFTPDILQMIINKNLTLFQYYEHLYPLLRSTISQPIRQQAFVCRDKQTQNNCSTPEQTPTESRVSGNLIFSSVESYSYQQIQQSLCSKQFISKLHPYINSLLTTTNIGIVRETLKMYMIMETNIEKSRALQRIKDVVNILTLHQIEKNVTCIMADLNHLNAIFSKIGLIIDPSQFQFYYVNIWMDRPEEVVQIGHVLNPKKLPVKYLQIYDLLGLGVEMEQTQLLKANLKQWMSSEEFMKHYLSQFKINKSNARAEQKLIRQNLNVVKQRIQYFSAEELLRQIEQSQYNIKNHYKQYQNFRQHLIYQLQLENDKKKQYNVTKSTKTIPSQLLSTFSKTQKSKIMSINNSPFSPPNFQQKPQQQTRQKVEQQIFNRKVLNGLFIRQQIYEELQNGDVQFIQDFQAIKCGFGGTLKLEGKGKLSSLRSQKNPSLNFGKEHIRNLMTNHNINECKTVKNGSNNISIALIRSQKPSKIGSMIYNMQQSGDISTDSMISKQNQVRRESTNYYEKKIERAKNEPFYGLSNMFYGAKKNVNKI